MRSSRVAIEDFAEDPRHAGRCSPQNAPDQFEGVRALGLLAPPDRRICERQLRSTPAALERPEALPAKLAAPEVERAVAVLAAMPNRARERQVVRVVLQAPAIGCPVLVDDGAVPGQEDGTRNGRAPDSTTSAKPPPGSMIRLQRSRKKRFGCEGTPRRRLVSRWSLKNASVRSRSSSAQRTCRLDRSAIRILRRRSLVKADATASGSFASARWWVTAVDEAGSAPSNTPRSSIRAAPKACRNTSAALTNRRAFSASTSGRSSSVKGKDTRRRSCRGNRRRHEQRDACDDRSSVVDLSEDESVKSVALGEEVGPGRAVKGSGVSVALDEPIPFEVVELELPQRHVRATERAIGQAGVYSECPPVGCGGCRPAHRSRGKPQIEETAAR